MEEKKATVLTNAIWALALVLVITVFCATWFLIDREAYKNGYVPVQNNYNPLSHLEKPVKAEAP